MDVFKRALDFNVKGTESVQVRTAVGGLVTMASACLCFLLLVSELVAYSRVDVVNHMTVDSQPPSLATTVPINFHITFPLVPCKDISFDAESTRGDAVVHLAEQDVRKSPAKGTESTLQTPAGQEGCTVEGTLFTGKVAGEFRINLGEDVPVHLAPMVAVDAKTNFTAHKIHHFSVGERKDRKSYPLDGLETIPDGEGHYLYNLRIIPTVEKPLYGAAEHNYEFAFQESLHKGVRLSPGMTALTLTAPGIHFFYEFYPVMVEYTHQRKPFLQFVTQVLAVVGGIFTISNILDSILYQSARAIKKLA